MDAACNGVDPLPPTLRSGWNLGELDGRAPVGFLRLTALNWEAEQDSDLGKPKEAGSDTLAKLEVLAHPLWSEPSIDLPCH